MRTSSMLWTLALLAALAAFPLVAPALGLDFYISFVRRVLIYALAATSLNLILGYGGMVALGHAAFFGAGPSPRNARTAFMSSSIVAVLAIRDALMRDISMSVRAPRT